MGVVFWTMFVAHKRSVLCPFRPSRPSEHAARCALNPESRGTRQQRHATSLSLRRGADSQGLHHHQAAILKNAPDSRRRVSERLSRLQDDSHRLASNARGCETSQLSNRFDVYIAMTGICGAALLVAV